MSALARSLDLLRRQGIAAWWLKARHHVARRYLLRRYRARHRRLHRNWYAKQAPKVSIVIPSYNDHRVLKVCLRSLLRTTDSRHTDIVIADDASPSEDHQAFLDTLRHPHVRVVRRRENGGFAKAVNTGIQATPPDRDVILLNSDTEARHGWLEALLYGASVDARVGIVGAKLLYPDGTIQSAGTFRNPTEPEWFDHYYRFQPAFFAASMVPSYVFATTGACMLIRRAVLESIGLLDERYPMAFEDVDFCLRAIEAGFRVLYYPHAVLIHHESATRGRGVGPRELSAKQLFWERWRGWFDSRQVRNRSGQTRIIYVLHDRAIPGRDRMVVEHVNRLRSLGYDTEVFALQSASAHPGLSIPLRTFTEIPRLIEELSRQDAIKVATGPKTAEPVWLGSLQRGIPAYYVDDLEDARPTDGSLREGLALSKYRREFHYLTTSASQEGHLRELGFVSRRVSHGVDPDTFRVTPELRREADILLTVGEHRANFELTLQGWRSLAEPRPRLWAFGAEPELMAGIDRSRYVAGPSEAEVNQLLNRATAFITTSMADTTGSSILQAMAAGAPVICTETAARVDGCVTAENCLVVEPDPASVAGAVRRLLSDACLQDRLRAAGLETAARHGWGRVIRDVASFYDSIGGHYCWTQTRQGKT